MRLLECLRLRVKDVEFTRREIIVRRDKGNKDRVTVLPENLMAPLPAQLQKARAPQAWAACICRMRWPPNARMPTEPRRGNGSSRHGCGPSTRARMRAPVNCWSGATLCTPNRCSAACADRQAAEPACAAPFVCHALAASGLRHPHVQELLRHADVSTTVTYNHVLNKGGRGILSQLDAL